LKDILPQNDYMGKIDLQNAYLTVPVDRKHCNYLKFHWKGKNYRFQSLLFGLATVPRVFTKVLCPLAAKMRRLGILYLNDIVVLAQSRVVEVPHGDLKL